MESCVRNQTFKDESCLVSCAGIHADIANDIDSLKLTTQALEQNVIKGGKSNILWHKLCIYQLTLGFQTLTNLLGAMAWDEHESKDKMIAALKQMFPTLALAEKKVDEVTRLTEVYHKYKRKFVKHLSFNPEENDTSKYLSSFFDPSWLVYQSFIWVFPVSLLDHAPLEAVFIYFDTATYDEIEKDVKATLYLLTFLLICTQECFHEMKSYKIIQA